MDQFPLAAGHFSRIEEITGSHSLEHIAPGRPEMGTDNCLDELPPNRVEGAPVRLTSPVAVEKPTPDRAVNQPVRLAKVQFRAERVSGMCASI